MEINYLRNHKKLFPRQPKFQLKSLFLHQSVQWSDSSAMFMGFKSRQVTPHLKESVYREPAKELLLTSTQTSNQELLCSWVGVNLLIIRPNKLKEERQLLRVHSRDHQTQLQTIKARSHPGEGTACCTIKALKLELRTRNSILSSLTCDHNLPQ